MYRVILFDLDGTLMETAPEIADALNATLQRLGHERVADERVRSWIGDGARVLLARALSHVGAAQDEAASAKAWAILSQEYLERCGSNSEVFPGVRAMLQRLREQGCRLALLTNKEARFAHALLARHEMATDFDLIVAGDTLPVKKPHPDVIAHVLQALDAQAEETLLVGDSITDVRAARAGGIAIWLVRHGYLQHDLQGDDRPDGFIDHFDDFHPDTVCRTAIQ